MNLKIKTKKKTIKSTVAFAAVMIIVIASGGAAVLASVSSKSFKYRENYFTPAKISVAVVENDNGNEQPCYENTLTFVKNDKEYNADKKVSIANLDDDDNNASAYIRAAVIPRWICVQTDGDVQNEIDVTNKSGYASFGDITGITISENSYMMGDVIFRLVTGWDKDWFYNSSDGFFYCRNQIVPGKTTPQLLDSVAISTQNMDTKYSDVQLTVDILADAVQTEGGAVSERWDSAGIEINDKKQLVKKEGF